MSDEGKIRVTMLANLFDETGQKKDGKEYVVTRKYYELHSRIMAPVKKAKKK